MSGRCVGQVGERELVRAIRRLVGRPGEHGGVGPGDDAAVFQVDRGRLVWSVDRQRAGTHFESHWLTPREAGHRAATIAASDVWAMGAEPRWVLSALELPADLPLSEFEEIVGGLAAGAAAAGAELVGGDVGVAEVLAMVTTVGGPLADGATPLLRSGARPGDELWVVGEVGWAAAGRALLAAGGAPTGRHGEACLEAFRSPRTPVAFCRWAATAGAVHAMMDISDGLAIDLHRLCEESRVGAEVVGDSLAAAVPAAVAAEVGVSPSDLALGGGDDYAMLCAVAPGSGEQLATAAAGFAVRHVGAVTDAATGIVVAAVGGHVPLPSTGWDPFR